MSAPNRGVSQIMRTLKHLLCLVALLATETICAAEVYVSELEPNRYELRLVNDAVVDEDTAQAALVPVARQVCGQNQPSFGPYRYAAQEALEAHSGQKELPKFEFVQQIECGAVGEQRNEHSTQAYLPVTETSEAELKAAITAKTSKYLELKSSDNPASAYEMLGSSIREAGSYDTWARKVEAVRSGNGRVLEISVARITVYRDPPGAPLPGTYIAADFRNRYENAPLECGYLIWYQTGPNAFEITREESGVIPKGIMDSVSSEKLEEIKRQFKCVTG